MLTIEEQIERIADHALERASAPVRAPRRWPTMAAAAALIAVAGSVVWAVAGREPNDQAGVGSSGSDPLATLLVGAVEYPLSSAEPPGDPSSAGLSIRLPGTARAVMVPEGETVFRESGVTALPGFGVFEARCAGVAGRATGCELPDAPDLPWVLDLDPHRLGVWVDVPADVDIVVLTDGDRRIWQRPVNGLAVWPPPTDSRWTLDAFDVTGQSIGRIDQTTIDDRLASGSPRDEDDAAEITTTLSNFRQCLTSSGATFDVDATLPQFPAGIDPSSAWEGCVKSTLDGPAPSGTAAAETAAGQIVLPTAFPGSWRVFAVSRTSSIVRPSADQVFGRYEQNGLVGLRVTVTANEFLGVGQRAELIELRGHDAGIFEDVDGWHVQWSEDGVLVDVTSTGLGREALLAALEQLEIRPDAITGFQPGSAPPELSLLTEAITDETTPQVMTGLRLSEGDALPSRTEGGGVGVFDRTITIFISDRSGLFGSAPQIVFGGERRGDLVVAPDPAGGNGLAALLADGTIVLIRLPEGIGSEVAEDILQGLAPQPASAFVALQDKASALLAQLPEVMAAPIDEQHTLRLRGGTADAPEAMCLDIDGIERCKLAMVASPIGDPSWVNGAMIDDHWYLFGFEPAEQGWLTIAPWRAGETFDPLSPTGRVVEGVHYWLSEVPTDVDDVRVLDLASVEGQETTFRRPDR